MNEQAKELIELANRKTIESNNKFIAITSGKGGVGKTSFAVNFAYQLVNTFSKKVLLIDADIGMADVHVVLNIKPENNLRHILNGKRLEDVVIKRFGIDVLPGFSGIESLDEMEDFLATRVIQDLTDFSEKYDYVIIDTSAGINTRVSAFVRAANRSYVITTPEPTAYLDAYALIKSIFKIYKYSNFKLIINMCKNKNEAIETYERLNQPFKRFLDKSFELFGWIPLSETVNKSIKEKRLISETYPSDKFVKHIKEIAAKEVGEPILDSDKNFWKKLMEFIKR
ncbi:AAA family ATPase [Hydrogenivirga sp. 128-5-R1-1]|uniref:AAA family ATPase n=1 Tax=Hydrogenivirga sp. 128-5-R1-1 TaxID=392423 RepID=UPI00015F36A7|nr:AAA family ATPase [Hydrogenivirga sp. 128-5-R1-1]EDP73344.1 flagellar biosynthesis protein (FlhG)-like protein [Hydrogenivirga sp. 128-5-R1-1]